MILVRALQRCELVPVEWCGVYGLSNLCSKSGKSPDNYELEIESLRDIIEQYKRSVQSLVNEVELKRLQEEEYERKVNVERV